MKELFIRVQIFDELPSGQKLVGLMANNADGIRFYTDDESLVTADKIGRHSAWVYEGKPIHCKQCGFAPYYSLRSDSHKFCPCCGAKMDGAE